MNQNIPLKISFKLNTNKLCYNEIVFLLTTGLIH